MLPHPDTLSWFRANQSFLFLLTAVCLAEKQQIPILQSLVWPDRGSKPRSTAHHYTTDSGFEGEGDFNPVVGYLYYCMIRYVNLAFQLLFSYVSTTVYKLTRQKMFGLVHI